MSIVAISRSLSAPSKTTLEDGSEVHSGSFGGQIKAVWTPLLNSDTGAPFTLPQFADKSVQIGGTFGAGGTVVIEGSNDGVSYFTLYDSAGNLLSFTVAGLKDVAACVGYIRPRVSAGDGTTSLTVTMQACRSAV